MSRSSPDSDGFFSEEDDLMVYKRKRTTLRLPGAADEHPLALATASPGGSITYDDNRGQKEEDEDDDDDEVASTLLHRQQGWPTRLQLQRRLRRAWLELRLVTVLQVLVIVALVVLSALFLFRRVVDRERSSHFSVVALLRPMRATHLHRHSASLSDTEDPTAAAERWQFALQWSALQSWSAQLRGENILVFVDGASSDETAAEDTCTLLEQHIRSIQCFIVPRACLHPEYLKPRLDCIFPVVHAHAPTDTLLVYLNGPDVLLSPELGHAIKVVQDKQQQQQLAHGAHFVLTGQRTDLAISEEVLAHFREKDFVAKLLATAAKTNYLADETTEAAGVGKLHSPDAIDFIVYQRSWFETHSALGETFPPFLAGAPFWDAWFWAQAVLDESVLSIDVTASVRTVHLQRMLGSSSSTGGAAVASSAARGVGPGSGTPRVGAPFNNDLAKALSGNSWRVGTLVSNADLALVGNCALGAANVRELTPSSSSSAPQPSSSSSDDASSSAEVYAALIARERAPVPTFAADPLSLSAGCYLAPNTHATDLVLLTKRASPTGWLVVVPVYAATLPLALHWLCWAERIHFVHFVVHALDRVSGAKLRARKGVPVIQVADAPEELRAPSASSGGIAAPPAAHVEFLGRVLHAGFHFVSADVDSLWLEDPLPELEQLHVDVAAQAVPPATDENEGNAQASPSHGDAFGRGGLLAVRATTHGRYFWNKVVQCQREQPTFSVVAMASAPGSDPQADAQQSHRAPALPDYAASECVSRVRALLAPQQAFTTAVLDAQRFVSGSAFFGRFEPQLRGVLPAVVRNDLTTAEAAATLAASSPDPKLRLVTSGDRVKLQLRRLQDWGLASADDESEECVARHSMPFPAVQKKPKDELGFRLLIRVLTYNRPQSLERLLTSLSSAEYPPEARGRVRLEISVDHPPPLSGGADSDEGEKEAQGWADVLALARSFTWKLGSKSVIEQTHNIGLVGQWTRGWTPSPSSQDGSDEELCLFLEDDMELEAGWFRWLSAAVARYYLDPAYFDPNVFGISLQKQNTIVGESVALRFGSRTPSDVLAVMAADHANNKAKSALSTSMYKYQLIGTWGAVMFPAHWRAFQSWLSERRVDTIQGTSSLGFSPCVPTLVLNKWWMAEPHKTWTAWFVRFAYEKGWYALYPNFPDGQALARNHREPGLHFQNAPAKGPQAFPLLHLTEEHMHFPLPCEIPVFDFHFRLVSEANTLAYRPALAPERFLGPAASIDPRTGRRPNLQCWLVDQLAPTLRREADERRARAEATVRAEQEAVQAAAEAAAKAAEEARKADLTAKRKARLAAAAAAKEAKALAEAQAANGTLPASTTVAAAAGKKDAKDAKAAKDKAAKDKTKGGEKEKGKDKDSKDKAKDKPKRKVGPKESARLKELKLLSKLPEADVLSWFDASRSSETAQLQRYLSVSLEPLWLGYPKSRWLSVDDGGRFGAVGHFIASKVDKESKVVASAHSDVTFKAPATAAAAKLAALAPALSTMVLSPVHMSSLKDGSGTDFAVCVDSFLHADAPELQVKEMLRVAKKGVVLLEPHDSKVHAENSALFPVALQKALAPLAGQTGVGSGVRADAGELAAIAKEHGVVALLFRVFSDSEADVARVTKDVANGARPSAMLATLMLKKAPTKSQLARFTKAGYIAANL